MISPSSGSDWQLIAALKPELRQHVRVYPQEYRSQLWYILRDESSGNHLRISAAAYHLVARLDGSQTVASIWELLSENNQAELSQQQIILTLQQLLQADLIRSGAETETQAHMQRVDEKGSKTAKINPLAIRIPLADPDALVNTLVDKLKPLLGSRLFIVMFSIILSGLLLALLNLSELQSAIAENFFTPHALLIPCLIISQIQIIFS